MQSKLYKMKKKAISCHNRQYVSMEELLGLEIMCAFVDTPHLLICILKCFLCL